LDHISHPLIPVVYVLFWFLHVPEKILGSATFQTALIPGYAEKDPVARYWIVSTTTRVHVQTYAYSHKTTTTLHVLGIPMPLYPPLFWLGVRDDLPPQVPHGLGKG
jgi:hypothetical protein